MPPPSPKDVTKSARKVARPLIVSCVVLLAALTLKITLEEREEVIPQRSSFSGFPMVLNEWRGKGDRLETLVLDALKLDDYFIADYHNDAGEQVNLYVAYYASQRKGESVHSPRSCLPGGGWQITGLTQRPIVGVTASGRPLTVNRVEIAKGEYRQLVYYWFQGRGRIITNEYLVKWFLFWDSLIKRRTDGALVRLTSLVAPGMDMDDADRRLEAFAREVAPYLDAYIPKE
jgi:EpsI family protein